jgi:hypothetical protein
MNTFITNRNVTMINLVLVFYFILIWLINL